MMLPANKFNSANSVERDWDCLDIYNVFFFTCDDIQVCFYAGWLLLLIAQLELYLLHKTSNSFSASYFFYIAPAPGSLL